MIERQTHYDWAFGWRWLVVCANGMAIIGMGAFTAIWTVGEVFKNIEMGQ